MDRMTHPQISDAIDTAVVTECDFVLTYHDLYGDHTVFGKRMSRPVTNSVLYDRWEGMYFHTTGLLYTSEIVAIWTEYDYCQCGVWIVNLDNRDGDNPLCDVCAREGYESARGDGLREDGGL